MKFYFGTNGEEMYTPFMQRAAIVGLFMGVWNSMEGTKAYDEMWRAALEHHEGYVTFEVHGRIAQWRTMVSDGFAASWEVKFKDASLGAWSLTILRRGGVGYISWTSGDGRSTSESKIGFDDETFVRMFEALRQSAAAYIRHHGFSVDQHKNLVGGIVVS